VCDCGAAGSLTAVSSTNQRRSSLAGNNVTLQGETTSTALGDNFGTTSVEDGGTLALTGGITIAGETITLNGLGAAGQPGVLVNFSGNSTIAASSSIIAQAVSIAATCADRLSHGLLTVKFG
jgi:hypothetical protein